MGARRRQLRLSSPRATSSPAVLALLLGAAWPVAASAQQVDIPRNVQAGSLPELIEEAPPALPVAAPAKPYTPVDMPPGAEKVRLSLVSLQIQGASVYPEGVFESFYRDLLGKEISLREIYVVADKIRRTYHDDGYVLTQVFLPEQIIRGGTIRIQVVEGYVSELRWAGDAPESPLMRAMAEEITQQRPFSSRKLEDVMLRLNELPGVSVTAALEPLPKESAAEGAVGIALAVERRQLAASLNMDNHASRYLGVWQTSGSVEGYGLLSPVDKLRFSAASALDPSRMRYGALDYSLPVHASGTSLSIGGSMSYTHPGYLLKYLDIFSYARSFTLGVTQPVLRSRTESLTLNAQFTLRNTETDVLETSFSEDRLRVLEVTGTYTLVDGWGGSNLLSLGIGKGLNVLDATETGTLNLSRANGHSDFTKLMLTASRLQAIDEEFMGYALVRGQKASAALLSSEQFGFGGSALGRGYDSSEISGDDALALSLELRHRGISGGDWGVQPFVFYDVGRGWEKEFQGNVVSAASAGLGARAQWQMLQLETVLAFPLTYTPATPKLGSDDKDPRLGMQIGVTF